MIQILVDSEETKQKLLAESEYLHYFNDLCTEAGEGIAIDSNKISTIMRLHLTPEIIIVSKNSNHESGSGKH